MYAEQVIVMDPEYILIVLLLFSDHMASQTQVCLDSCYVPAAASLW